MCNEFSKQKNTALLNGICVVFPILALAAAHWFPWRRIRGRHLHRLEAYAIGTAAIVGTSGAAIALSNGDKNDHVTMLALATAAAGGITVAAHAIDAHMKDRGDIADLRARIETLTSHGDI